MKGGANYAFIDSQNLNLGISGQGWKLGFKKFRVYLEEKYGVTKAYLFLGFISENQKMYNALEACGYILVFRPILKLRDGLVKGNCDAELVLQAMIDFEHYERAVIVTGDGDFYCMVNYLASKQKLAIVLSPNWKSCSVLLRRAARDKIMFMNDLRSKLEYKNEKAPPEDRTQGSAFSS